MPFRCRYGACALANITFKNDELEGLGTLDGKPVFFKGGLPVDCEIQGDRIINAPAL